MTELMTGLVQFLTVAPELNSSDIALVCFVRSLVAAYPTIQIERLVDGRPDTGQKIEVFEVTDTANDPAGSTTNGQVKFVAKKVGVIRGGAMVWEFLVRSAPGGQGAVTFRLSAGVPPHLPIQLLAESSSTNVPVSILNTTDPVKIVFASKVLPRLSAGINQATPEAAPTQYRGYSKGSGDTGKLPGERNAQNVAALLHQLFFQLDAPYTFDPAWDQQAGINSWADLSRSAFAVSPIAVAEERWARQVTEMLLLTVYRGPQLLYGAFDDFNLSATTFLDGANPYYGLGHRCQDLATFGVASRGVTIGKYQITAGSAAAATVTHATPAAKWYVDQNDPKVEVNPTTQTPAAQTGRPQDLMQGDLQMNLRPLIEKVPEYGAAAVHLFSNPRPVTGIQKGTKTYQELIDAYNKGVPEAGRASIIGSQTIQIGGKDKTFPAQKTVVVSPKNGAPNGFSIDYPYLLLTDDQQYVRDNQGSAHIAFSIRVRHDLKKVQFFDTGALNIDKNDTDLFSGTGGFHSGNYDSIGTTNIRSLSSPYKGTGVFPPLDVDGAKKLKDVIEQLAKARPIGLARLALLDRNKLASVTAKNPKALVEADGALIYASALLPMWGQEADQNYHISRYLWSLRNMPNASALEGVWMLYVPLGKYAQALAGARGTNIIDAAKTLVTSGDFSRGLAKLVLPLQDLVVGVDGRVKSLANGGTDIAPKHLLHKLESSTTGDVPLPLNEPFPRPPNAFAASTLPPYFRA